VEAKAVEDVMSALETYLSTCPHPENRGFSVRVGVLGDGFGGLVALQVLAIASDRFAVGITLGGVSAPRGVDGFVHSGGVDGASSLEAEGSKGRERFGRLELARVNVPLLLLHGERDERCAVSFVKAICQAVFARGVPAQLALYPGSRVLEQPAQRRDAARRVCAWLLKHLPPKLQ